MFIYTTITSTDRKNVFYINQDSPCVVNTRHISELITSGTGSQFELVLESNHRYSGVRVISTSTVAEMILAMDNPLNPTTYAATVYLQNNGAKGTHSVTIPTEDILIMFPDAANSGNTYIWYVSGDKIEKALVQGSISIIYTSFVTFAGPPTNLVATVTGATEITLTWTVNATGQTGVAISESTDGGLTYPVTYYYYGAAIATSTQIGLTTGNTYFYKARSFKGSAFTASYTSYSNVVSEVPA